MKYRTLKKILLLFIYINSQNLIASEYQINSTYGVDVWGGTLSETFNANTSTFQIDKCRDVTFSLFPQNALNDTKYSLYTSSGIFVSYSNNDYQFWNVPLGTYVIKDGNVTLFNYEMTYTNPNTLYEVILTDDSYNTITEFSASALNSLTLSAAVMNLNTSVIDDCAPYINWTLNGNYVNDINSINLTVGDSLCVGIDGIEACTENCYSYAESCYIVTESISASIDIENNFGTEFSVFPNPTDGEFSIDLGKNYTTVSITLTDLNGKLIQSKQYNQKELLNLKLEEPKGTYLLIIESGDKRVVIPLVKK